MDLESHSGRGLPDLEAGPELWRVPPDGWQDSLTALPGPAFWSVILTAESARHSRYRRPITLVLAEIAGLETLAASWGNDVAAQTVVTIGRACRTACRTSDYVARLGIGRLGILLTETDEIAAINLVERVRERCERRLRGTEEGLRVAFGWASPSPLETLLAAQERAEARLHRETTGAPTAP